MSKIKSYFLPSEPPFQNDSFSYLHKSWSLISTKRRESYCSVLKLFLTWTVIILSIIVYFPTIRIARTLKTWTRFDRQTSESKLDAACVLLLRSSNKRTQMEMNSTISNTLEKYVAEELMQEMSSSVRPVSVFVGIETVFGFCGNLLVLYVYLFRYHKCNFKYFVLSLAFVDILSCLTTLPGEIVTQTFWYNYPFPILCKVKSFFNGFTIYASVICLLIIAVDRFRKLCRPLHWQIKPTVARILCGVNLGISFVLALPLGISAGTYSYHKQYKGINIKVTVCGEKSYTTEHLSYTVGMWTIISVSNITTCILYVFVSRKILTATAASKVPESHSNTNNATQKAETPREIRGDSEVARSASDIQSTRRSGESRKPEQDDESQPITNTLSDNKNISQSKFVSAWGNETGTTMRPQRKLFTRKIRRKTLIMLILTVVFVSTTILYLTLLSLVLKGILRSLTNAEKCLYFFFFRLYFINHVINPILYGVLDRHFRRVLRHMGRSAVNVFSTSFCTKVHSTGR